MEKVGFRQIKPEIRGIAFDDCAFTRYQKEVFVIGVIYRGGNYLDGMVSTKINVDGLDSTEKLIACLKNSPHYKQVRVIMLNGITLGGFNIVNIQKLFKETRIPVIAIIREKPDLESIKKALKKNFADSKMRISLISKAGAINSLHIKNLSAQGALHYQKSGIEKSTAEKIIKLTATRSIVPEPLRAAHLICSGLKTRITS